MKQPSMRKPKSHAKGAERGAARIIAAEKKHSPKWFYLSFATDTAFLGAAFVWAHGLETAKRRASKLGISFPGADVMYSSVPRKELWRLSAADRNRLLNAADIDRLQGEPSSQPGIYQCDIEVDVAENTFRIETPRRRR